MKIKFRGRGLKDKKLYYGSYVQTMPQSSFPAILDNDGFYNEVDPESVAQFVGYDCNGDEVYEGDILENDSGGEFKASLKSIITSLHNPCYCRYLEKLNHRKYYRLKESGKNDNL